MEPISFLDPCTVSLIRSTIAITSVSQAVEELIFNALDAGASKISIKLNLSLGSVTVEDNGHGFQFSDLKLAGERYATSKLKNLEDLNTVASFGFRGEALASLKDISTLEIKTRSANSLTAFGKLFKEGKCVFLGPSSQQRQYIGTTVKAYNLFYNLPVRRQRLVEVLEVEAIKKRTEAVFIMHPNVTFVLQNGIKKTEILHTRKCGNPELAFRFLYGKQRKLSHHKFLPISRQVGRFKLIGFISNQGHTTKDYQFFYMNGRLVLKTRFHTLLSQIFTDSTISGKRAYGENADILPIVKGTLFGVYILNLKCSPSEYDICLEPSKTSVEMNDWDDSLDCINVAVSQCLKENSLNLPTIYDKFLTFNRLSTSQSKPSKNEKAPNATTPRIDGTPAKMAVKEFCRSAVEKETTISRLKQFSYSPKKDRLASQVESVISPGIVKVIEEDANFTSARTIIAKDSAVGVNNLFNNGLVHIINNDDDSVAKHAQLYQRQVKEKLIELIPRQQPNPVRSEYSEHLEHLEHGDHPHNSLARTATSIESCDNEKDLNRAIERNTLDSSALVFFAKNTAKKAKVCSSHSNSSILDDYVKICTSSEKERIQESTSAREKDLLLPSTAPVASPLFSRNNDVVDNLSTEDYVNEFVDSILTTSKTSKGAKAHLNLKSCHFSSNVLSNETTQAHDSPQKLSLYHFDRPDVSEKGERLNLQNRNEYQSSSLVFETPNSTSKVIKMSTTEVEKNLEIRNYHLQFGATALDDFFHENPNPINNDIGGVPPSSRKPKIVKRVDADNYNEEKNEITRENFTKTNQFEGVNFPAKAREIQCFKNDTAIVQLGYNKKAMNSDMIQNKAQNKNQLKFRKELQMNIQQPKSTTEAQAIMSRVSQISDEEIEIERMTPKEPNKIRWTPAPALSPLKKTVNRKAPNLSKFKRFQVANLQKNNYNGNTSLILSSTQLAKIGNNASGRDKRGDENNLLNESEIGSDLETDIEVSKEINTEIEPVTDDAVIEIDDRTDKISTQIINDDIENKVEIHNAGCGSPRIQSTLLENITQGYNEFEKFDNFALKKALKRNFTFSNPSIPLYHADSETKEESEYKISNVIQRIGKDHKPLKGMRGDKSDLYNGCKSTNEISEKVQETSSPSLLKLGVCPVGEIFDNDITNKRNVSEIEITNVQNLEYSLKSLNSPKAGEMGMKSNSNTLEAADVSITAIFQHKQNRVVKYDGQSLKTGMNGTHAKIDRLKQQLDNNLPDIRINCQGYNSGENCSDLLLEDTSNNWDAGLTVKELYQNWENPVFVDVIGPSLKVKKPDLPTKFHKNMLKSAKVLRQIERKFIICHFFNEDNPNTHNLLVIIDQHAAHERVRLEKLLKEMTCWSVETMEVKPLITIQSFTTNSLRLVDSYKHEFRKWGIECIVDGQLLYVHRLPRIILEAVKIADLFTVVETTIGEHIETLRTTAGTANLPPRIFRRILDSKACRGAIKFGDKLDKVECEELISSLSQCEFPFQCAHGRPSLIPVVDINQWQNKQNEPPNLKKFSSKLLD